MRSRETTVDYENDPTKYHTSHQPIVDWVVSRGKARNVLELGCGWHTSPQLSQTGLPHTVYSRRPEWSKSFLSQIPESNVVLYDDIHVLQKQVELGMVSCDFAVIGGPLEDRGHFASSLIKARCPVILLLDHTGKFSYKCGYTTLRHPYHDKRVFTNLKSGNQSALLILNELSVCQVPEHE